MSNLVEDIFLLDDALQFSYNRYKEDYIKVSPVTGTSLNNPGSIRFEVNNQQNYICLSDSFLVCEFSITKGDGTPLGNDDITLEHNFFPRCFNGMSLTIGGREVENIAQAVGEASTITNFIMTSDVYKRTYGIISGNCPDTGKGDNDVDNAANDANQGYYMRRKVYNDKKKFTLMFPLKSVFGFMDYKKILYLIKINLSLIKKDDAVISPDIFYGAAATTGKIIFHKLEWWIPSIQPSLEIEEMIMKRLNTKVPIDITFKKNTSGTNTIPTGSTNAWKLGNVSNAVRFIFLAFKPTAAPSFQTNNALFTDHVGADRITSIRIQMNNNYYPIDRMEFDFANHNIVEPYNSYVECCKTFGVEPQLSYQEYHDLYPIFVIDVSAQDERLKTNGIDITVHIEKSSGLTLQGFYLMKEDC